MREDRVLVLPVNIPTVWHASFTWPQVVCLDKIVPVKSTIN